MKVPHFRIAWLMGFVAMAALNFGAIRALSDFKASNTSDAHLMLMIDVLGAGVIPMVNILAVGLPIGLRCGGSRPFLLGFATFGALALALFAAGGSLFTEELVIPYLHLALKPLATIIGIGLDLSTVDILALFSVAGVMLVLPQVALALIGGFIFRKFRIARADSTRC